MGNTTGFLKRPGLSGTFGAIMDEYARAAEDFCRVIEGLEIDRFRRVRASVDPDTVSLQAICTHAVRAAHRYADYILKARNMLYVETFELAADALTSPADLRGLLREMLQYTEDAVEGLDKLPEEELAVLTFPVRWGPIYDPEMILEHGIVHLLRHRRQVERWTD
jgi:hypothetical protein